MGQVYTPTRILNQMRMHTHVRTGTPKTYAAPAEAKYADDGVKVVKISLEPGRGGSWLGLDVLVRGI